MLDYLDADLKNFVNRYITSFLAWDLVVFFHKNPGTADGAGELAIKLGRRAEDIERAASELADKAILKNDNLIYGYAPSEEARVMVAKFVQAINDREQRLLILTNVLQKR